MVIQRQSTGIIIHLPQCGSVPTVTVQTPSNSRRFCAIFSAKTRVERRSPHSRSELKPEWNGVRPIREANSAWANASYIHALDRA